MSSAFVYEAGPLDNKTILQEKRHSRSLDLSDTARIPHSRHQRSASESDGLVIQPEDEDEIPNFSPTTPSTPNLLSVCYNAIHPAKDSNLRKHLSKSKASITFPFSNLRQPTSTSSNMNKMSNNISGIFFASKNQDNISTATINRKDDSNNTALLSNNNLQDQKGGSKYSLPSDLQKDINQFALEGYSKKFFDTHKRGIFRRSVNAKELMTFTKNSIKRPLLLSNKHFRTEALTCFKNIQILMGDRPMPNNTNEIDIYEKLLENGINPNSLRDEIYVQICRQLSNNPNESSIRKGWEVMCVVSVTFPPSKHLEPHLLQFVKQHHAITNPKEIDVLSKYVTKKLEMVCNRSRVPPADEIEYAIKAPFSPVFGKPLNYIMDLQSDLRELRIPQIVPLLADAVHELKGKSTEGIFRTPGDVDEVIKLRIRIEKRNPELDLFKNISDPNVPASLLKSWLRELSEPLIPKDIYNDCIENAQDKLKVVKLINTLPDVNRRIALYMIRLLQDFADPEVTKSTKMSVSNLAMVFAPNFLRCPSEDLNAVFINSKYEQSFLETLIENVQVEKNDCAYADYVVCGIKDESL